MNKAIKIYSMIIIIMINKIFKKMSVNIITKRDMIERKEAQQMIMKNNIIIILLELMEQLMEENSTSKKIIFNRMNLEVYKKIIK